MGYEKYFEERTMLYEQIRTSVKNIERNCEEARALHDENCKMLQDINDSLDKLHDFCRK